MIAILMENFYTFVYNSENTEVIVYTNLHIIKLGELTIAKYVDDIHSQQHRPGGVYSEKINMKVELVVVLRERNISGCAMYLSEKLKKLNAGKVKKLTRFWSVCDNVGLNLCLRNSEIFDKEFLKNMNAASFNKIMNKKYRELIRLKTQLRTIISKDYLEYNQKIKKIDLSTSQDILDGDILEEEININKLYLDYRTGDMPYAISKM